MSYEVWGRYAVNKKQFCKNKGTRYKVGMRNEVWGAEFAIRAPRVV